MSTFSGKTAIITGGASGIGRAIGEQLAEQGAMVVLADIDAERAGQTAEAISRGGGRAQAEELDVTDAPAVDALVKRTAQEHGSLDYIFNNAGIAIVAGALDHELDDWYRTLDINLRGVVHGVQAAYPLMLAQRSGHIVNIASLAGLVPAVNEIAYAAAKHGVVGLSTTLRAEAAVHGVKVSVVCPGFVDTPILYENLNIKNTAKFPFASREEVKKAIRMKAMPVDKAARIILHGVRRNKPVITVTAHAKVLWTLYRLSPRAAIGVARLFMREVRKYGEG